VIYHLSLEEILNPQVLKEAIYDDLDHDYYWSEDFSDTFYIHLAKAGFISVATVHEERFLLLPQIQTHYAILEFRDLHISHHVKTLLKTPSRYSLRFNSAFKEVIAGIKESYEDCWIHEAYERLLHTLYAKRYDDFKLLSTELFDTQTHTLVCGEIGYLCNNIYTGLTKFSLKDKAHKNWGTLQRVLLTQHLEKEGLAFCNLGHPQMEYKMDLGALVYDRHAFLKKCGLIV